MEERDPSEVKKKKEWLPRAQKIPIQRIFMKNGERKKLST